MKRPAPPAFTLVEALVVVAIFAVIGVAVGQFLTQGIAVESRIRERAENRHHLVRAMRRLDADMLQARWRGVRSGAEGRSLGPLLGRGAEGIELTRGGWRNPLRRRRSALQRVAYVLEEDTLVRLYWDVLDRAPDTEPRRQSLLSEVSRFETEFISVAGTVYSYWPPSAEGLSAGEGSGGQDSGQTAEKQLAGVRFRFELVPYGFIERLYQVPVSTAYGEAGN